MMNHSECDHPRTPKDRAKCRRRQKTIAGVVEDARVERGEPWHGKAPQIVVEPLTRRGRVQRGPMAVKPPTKRTQVLRAEHDLADVPHVFSSIIRWAWDHELEVKTGHTFNDTERTIVIESGRGWLTLIWRHTTPYGIHGQSWRPRGTSVASKLMTVQQGLMALESGQVE